MTPRICLLLLALALAMPDLVFGWEGKVVSISDGDTVVVMFRGRTQKIRLFGVDCPERDQDFGSRARQFTSDMVFGKLVEVEPVDRDRYERVVAWVTVGGKSLNRELLRSGMAWWYRRHAGTNIELGRLEKAARKSRVGLWSSPAPVPPWKYRRNQHPSGKPFSLNDG